MAFNDEHKHQMNLTIQAINAYEDWKDSPERYEWSASLNKDRCCVWLHRKNEPYPTDKEIAAA